MFRGFLENFYDIIGHEEGPYGMRRGPRSGRSPDTHFQSQRSKLKWEEPWCLLPEPLSYMA